MEFKCESFIALNTHTLFTIVRGRIEVFVVEQMCPYPELDDNDTANTTVHIYQMDKNNLLAYARCYEKNAQYSAIGRVLVAKSERGKGVAKILVNEAINCCKANWPERNIYIGAQTYLLDFYQSLGFESVNDEYLEDGIAHQDMILKLTD
ncbi:GNAT family N-acetyltransferase [Pseudoalteromonas sp. SG45-5]|uniref:GNAT family N-acetyltransferase n=1 Tax=unclassified Pseudoalteromonas TaxID=194690 RepID=UPI0015FCE021|nr:MULTISPECIES: GNAT family N-acetyltransferase [unclassified Pseudoalteromonas]MBB1384162.1 GNAT family N-acetyltransferase [Pseudoalteromonas sp. SG45-5]MBB1392464.1 GNAT family N-acetyltransferase [Pseudoalteromonas sp. SG44-4]MBB1446739.1 GNAT family N-acetyltransferase [Pseudoalteromonas sp. SG41-6]